MTPDLTTSAAVAIGIAIAVAILDWWSVATGRRWLEAWAKPAVLVALIAASVLLQPANNTIGWLVTAGLACGLLGDVALFLDHFELGTGVFLLGHVCYIIAFALAWHSLAFSAVALVAGLLLLAFVGRPIAKAAAREDERLERLVMAYELVLILMAVAAFGTQKAWAIAGANLFIVSDTYLGWTRFIGRETVPSRVVVHVTYHLAQIAFVIALLRLA